MARGGAAPPHVHRDATATDGGRMIHEERIQVLRPGGPAGGRYVLYWMQASVRTRFNHALEYAVQQANERRQPLLVCFGLTPRYPAANARHYRYLLEGLRDVSAALTARGIGFTLQLAGEGGPPSVPFALARDASLVVTDRGYLRTSRQWRAWLAERLNVPLVQVESEAVVPVDAASRKLEFAARTLRPKVMRLLERYATSLDETAPRVKAHDLADGLDPRDVDALLNTFRPDPTVPPGAETGGEVAAQARLKDFLASGLAAYDMRRNDPLVDGSSRLSAHLHYGHISPLDALLAARQVGGPGLAPFTEELVVRRELSFNLTEHNPDYDRYEGLPEWSRKTLEEHALDPRPQLFTPEQLERGETHDPYWNAAQRQMVQTGRMHNHLRMYWGKKVLEWTPTPQAAFDILMHLNDRYELDGRDPNSYAGISWVFGRHDRPWARRPIFGTVRYMAASGVKRKFDADAYARRWLPST